MGKMKKEGGTASTHCRHRREHCGAFYEDYEDVKACRAKHERRSLGEWSVNGSE